MLDEIEVCERPAKKMEQFNSHKGGQHSSNNINSYYWRNCHSHICKFASGVVHPVGLALCESTLLFSFATVITHKSFKEFTTKEEHQRPPLCLH